MAGTLGITLVLHTWAQDLTRHVHVHGIVTGGALTVDGQWVSSRRAFLFPVRALSRVFRGKYLEALVDARSRGVFESSAWTQDEADWTAFLTDLRKPEWVVYTSRLLAALSRSSPIWDATPIAARSASSG